MKPAPDFLAFTGSHALAHPCSRMPDAINLVPRTQRGAVALRSPVQSGRKDLRAFDAWPLRPFAEFIGPHQIPTLKDSDLPLPDSPPQGSLVVPRSQEDFEQYFDLRWRVLRAPWEQPRGSERDDREDESIHLMLRGVNGEALAVGRLHLNSPTEAQVRFMAVEPRMQGRNLGSHLLHGLEERARAAGARTIVLNAREAARPFYARHGYKVEGPAPQLFGAVDHVRMRKNL